MNYKSVIRLVSTQTLSDDQAKKFGKVSYLSLNPYIINTIEDTCQGVLLFDTIVGIRTHSDEDYEDLVIEICFKSDYSFDLDRNIMLQFKQDLERTETYSKKKAAKEKYDEAMSIESKENDRLHRGDIVEWAEKDIRTYNEGGLKVKPSGKTFVKGFIYNLTRYNNSTDDQMYVTITGTRTYVDAEFKNVTPSKQEKHLPAHLLKRVGKLDLIE